MKFKKKSLNALNIRIIPPVKVLVLIVNKAPASKIMPSQSTLQSQAKDKKKGALGPVSLDHCYNLLLPFDWAWGLTTGMTGYSFSKRKVS